MKEDENKIGFSRAKMLGLGASKDWGHVASALSMHSYLRYLLPAIKTDYDMIIGKPFGAQAYYSIWHEMGLIDTEQLNKLSKYIAQDELDFVTYAEPTLGNALGVAIGRTLSTKPGKNVWCNISDGALSMGPTLEAIISMANLRQHMNKDLLLTVDFNYHTSLDESIVDFTAMVELFQFHKWRVSTIQISSCDTDDVKYYIDKVLNESRMKNDWAKAQVIFFITEKGDGVEEIQFDLKKYHAKPLTITDLNYMDITEYADA